MINSAIDCATMKVYRYTWNVTRMHFAAALNSRALYKNTLTDDAEMVLNYELNKQLQHK